MTRRQAGLTQQALAERAGTSQAAVSAYESGRRSPSVDTLCRLLGAAGTEVRMRLAPLQHGSVATGDAPLTVLTDDERLVAHASIDADISATANSTSFGDRLAALSVATVSMDADGQMVRRDPDGTTSVL